MRHQQRKEPSTTFLRAKTSVHSFKHFSRKAKLVLVASSELKGQANSKLLRSFSACVNTTNYPTEKNTYSHINTNQLYLILNHPALQVWKLRLAVAKQPLHSHTCVATSLPSEYLPILHNESHRVTIFSNNYVPVPVLQHICKEDSIPIRVKTWISHHPT